ncbi:MAG: carboxypeptidase regulatory-like domain-containing protein [Bacteroidales bacterium]
MKRFALATLAFLALSLNGIAGNVAELKENQTTFSISGTVLDIATGEALAGVKIQICNTETAYSDFDGNFLVSGLLPGTYKLSTTYISYQSNELEINLNPQDLENIEVRIGQVTK